MPRDQPWEEPPPEIDLHGMRPADALKRLGLELHACRARRLARVLVIAGRGWGNRLQQPVLRPMVESWLLGPEGRRHGVLRFEVQGKGGALLVSLRTGAGPAGET